MNDQERAALFWSRVDFPLDLSSNACFMWAGLGGVVTPSGHVRISWSPSPSGKAYCHRVAWELSVGPLGDRILRHWLCSEPRCCRMSHLSPFGGFLANARDRDALGNRRAPTGEANGNARLTQQQADDIRAAKQVGVSTLALAREFGVSATSIRNVVRRRTYVSSDDKTPSRVRSLWPGTDRQGSA